MPTVGFVGLGNMGGPMAANLAAAGYEVRVFDLVTEAMQGVAGGHPQASAVAAATDVDVFISMLPAGRHVEGLYVNGGILEAVREDTLLIDCSTIDPDTAKRVAAAAADKGIKRFIHISSTAVYGVPDHHPLREEDRLIGVGPYGEAKIEAEKVCAAFRDRGLCVPVLRPVLPISPIRSPRSTLSPTFTRRRLR